MTEKTRIDLKVILPDIPDEQDACVARLESRLGLERWFDRFHIVRDGDNSASLCLHFDPSIISLAEVERIAKAAGAEIHNQYGHVVLSLRAIAAEDAAQGIEASLRSMPGVLSVSVSIPAQRVRIEFERKLISVSQLENAINELGYSAAELQVQKPSEHCHHDCHHDHDHSKRETWYGRNQEFVWSLASGVLLAIAWVGQTWLGLPKSIAIVLYVTAYGFGSAELLGHMIKGLRKGQFHFDIDLLMLLAAVGAAALGDWVEGAFLLFLFSLAHATEHYALGRARNAIRALTNLAPAKALIRRDGIETEVPVEQVVIGDTVIVHPAQRIPVDGRVHEGKSAVDQSPITGESIPVGKSSGDEVFAGTVNGTGALEIVASRVSGDTTLDRVVRLVEEAQTQRAPTQTFTDRFERIFVPSVLIGSLALIFVPTTLGFWTWTTGVYRGLALLVAASPCALALGTPSVVLAGIAQAARHGVLIKGGAFLEALGSVRAIAFDKTGTLTNGKPEVTDLWSPQNVNQLELLRIAAAVERRSQHPLGAAVVRRAEADGILLPDASDVESVTARGIQSNVEGRLAQIGSMRMFESVEYGVPESIREQVSIMEQRGRSAMVIRHGEEWLGVIGLTDVPRATARNTLNRLRDIGIEKLIMLTGDNAGVAKIVANEIGVDQFFAGLFPEDKVKSIRGLLESHRHVAMIGDGVNDAPALANATVGIAMGGAGTAAALETADVALMGDDLSKLPFAIGLSRFARQVTVQNLIIALGTIVVLAASTTLGWVRIGPAVVFHEGSTLVVLFNSLRLLGYTKDLK